MSIIGIDLGSAGVKVGRVEDEQLQKIVTGEIDNNADKFKILEQICDLIKEVFSKDTTGIGFGVPSVVDVEKGIVLDVANIPSWKRVHLKDLLEKRFIVPVYVNNRANCFAIGEKYFGRTKRYVNSVGLIIDRGVGSGIIINHKLYSGNNCMAGEFGKIPYNGNNIEYYCSERFFKNVYNKTGSQVYNSALDGQEDAINIFNDYGFHLGNAIKTILYSVDPDIIVLGGSVSKYFDLYEAAMWDCVRDFLFPQSIKTLEIKVSNTDQISVLGAAALYLDANT
jgi:glucokinase